jgi:hypothetical protein
MARSNNAGRNDTGRLMDHATIVSHRLKQFATILASESAKHADDYSIEEWLGFWDEDDSVFGNVRNLEHWLSQAAVSRRENVR